jgi:large subunit ribosomal protein L9
VVIQSYVIPVIIRIHRLLFNEGIGCLKDFYKEGGLRYNVAQRKDRKMKVIFIEDVTNVAKAGDIKEVADGYARNFLIPKKMAAVATASSISKAKIQMEKRIREKAKTEAEFKELAAQLEGKEVILTAKTGGKEKLYGSITSEDIASGLKTSYGVVVDKRKIEIPESIRQVGTFPVIIRLTADIAANISVNVKEEESA